MTEPGEISSMRLSVDIARTLQRQRKEDLEFALKSTTTAQLVVTRELELYNQSVKGLKKAEKALTNVLTTR